MQAGQGFTVSVQRGVFLVVLGTMLFAIGDGIAKFLASAYTSAQITTIRSGLGLCFVSLVVLSTRNGRMLRTERWPLHLLRGMLVTLIMLGFYYAVGHIPLIELEAIGHAAPFFVALLAPYVLRERVTTHHWLAMSVGFIGILIVLRPDPQHFHMAHVIMLACAVAFAVLIMLARLLAKTDSLLALNFYIYPLPFVIGLALALDTWIHPPLFHWALFLAFGAVTTGSIFAGIAALKHIEAALAATLDYSSLLWVSLIGFLFWDELPDGLSALGIALIIAGGIYIVRHTTRNVDESLVQTTEH